MQINLHNIKIVKPLTFFVLGFVACLWFKGCSSEQNLSKDKIIIKEVTKTLPADTIIKHQTITVKDRGNEKKLSKDIIDMHNRLQEYQNEILDMQSEFNEADSIQKAELYRLATELKKFESDFEDEYLKLKINGIIGNNEVKEITPTYTIKSKSIEVPKKEVKFRMLAGIGVGNSINFDKPLFNANIGFQNKKGSILRFSFDTEQRIMVGYDFSLFKISK